MLCKYSLIVGNVSYKLGDWCVKNWDEISYSIERVDYGGVTRSLTSKFEFYGKAYDILWEEYHRHYLLSEAFVTIETLDDNHRFFEKLRYRLDFSKLSYDGQLLTINAFDDSLATLIKANKGTVYEYPVSELKEARPLYYDRLKMKNMTEWLVTGDTEERGNQTYVTNTFGVAKFSYPVYITSQEIQTKNSIEIYDVEKQELDSSGFVPFLKCISDGVIHVKVSMELNLMASYKGGVGRKRRISLEHNMNGQTQVLYNQEISEGMNTFKVEKEIEMKKGYSVSLFIGLGETLKLSQVLPTTDYILIEFYGIDLPVDIDVISPVTILNRLLKSMNGGRDGIIGEIASGTDKRLDNTLIIAAESARGLNAKLYTSYSKFEKWMSVVFGYVPIIGNNTVKFVHRDSNFHSEQGIEFEEVTDFEYSIIDKLIYSHVRAGYEKKEYDSVNGRDEFRWTNDYNTGITLTANSLELISPYRADAYGIEFLAAKIGEETTDNSSDNDVFFVGAELNKESTKYILVRSGYEISGVIDPSSMFNVMYSPRSILEANKRFLGISMSSLRFASSEGNSDVIINGIGECDEFQIAESDRLFTVGEIRFSSTIDASEDDLPKIGKLIKDGITYEAYLTESKRKYGRYDGTDYRMCVKSVY